MKLKLYCIVFLINFISCKKDNGANTPPNNNEVNAPVILSSGGTVTINANGTKAILALSGSLGSPGFIGGTNAVNAAVYINLYPAISSAGTFGYAQGYRCQYRVNTDSTSTPIYENTNINSGNITITSVSDNYLEGSFIATCRNGSDSVTVSGTFKGNTIAK